MNTLISSIYALAHDAHREFAEKIWSKNEKAIHFHYQGKTICPCYHNKRHIIGVVEASKAITSALLDQKLDPLHIQHDLTLWNEKEYDNISLSEFTNILELTFAAHDLGNLTTDEHLIYHQNSVKLKYADHFQLAVGPCEERSANLALELIEYFDHEKMCTKNKKKLIRHLIMQTVFRPSVTTSDQPFWLLIQFIDQIASYFYSGMSVDHATAGYLNEIFVSSNVSERTPFNLQRYMSFFPNRFLELFPDDQIQHQVLDPLTDRTTQHNLLYFFKQAPDRPIEYDHDIKDIYRGKFNR